MWKARRVYKCLECRRQVRSKTKVYKYDDDALHQKAFIDAGHSLVLADMGLAVCCDKPMQEEWSIS